MKALSIRQPWASAILVLGKRIENRRWTTDFRGRFLLHAAKGTGTLSDFSDDCEAIRDILNDELAWGEFRDRYLGIRYWKKEALFIPHADLPRAGIVGAATLAAIVEPGNDPAPSPETTRWHAPDQYGFVLANVRAIPLIPCAGALGFFDVPRDVAAQIHALAAKKEPAPCG